MDGSYSFYDCKIVHIRVYKLYFAVWERDNGKVMIINYCNFILQKFLL